MAEETIDLRKAGESRRRRTLIAVGVVALLAFWAFWYVRSFWVDDGPNPSAAGEVTCPPAPVAASVSVNVYNATSTAGLAATVAADLRGHGFQVRTVGNAPAGVTSTGPATIVHGDAGRDAARTVARWVASAQLTSDARPSGTVDLVLGEGFTSLRAQPAPLCP